jgi:hypothetical protein
MKTLFLDMDGVVADFDGYAEVLFGKRPVGERWPKEDWEKLRDQTRLYRDLPKTQEADLLVDACRKFAKDRRVDLFFLTAIPKGNDMHWAFYDKVIWAQIHYPDIPVMFGPYSHDKHLHCTPGDILIDDRTSNINEWTAAGGNGILHKGDLNKTLSQLNTL